MHISGYWDLCVVRARGVLRRGYHHYPSPNQLSQTIGRIVHVFNMIAEEVPMSVFLLGSVSRGLSHARWLDAKTPTPTFCKEETGAAPAEEAYRINLMHDSISSKVTSDAHLQAVGPGEQGAFGHPDRGPLPDERGPHARPEEGRDSVPSAVLVRRSNHQVRSTPLFCCLYFYSYVLGCTWTTR